MNRLDEYMAACVEHRHFSGAALIASGGEKLLSKGFGLADRENDVPCTPQTRFRIGSITKAFTAMDVMVLQQRGKLEVSDTLKKHLTDAMPAWDEITIQHLFTHTFGIYDITQVRPHYAQMVTKSMTPTDLVSTFRDLPLLFPPGDKGEYSNSNYIGS